MYPSLRFINASLATLILALLTFSTSASPVQARAATTVYTYMSATPAYVVQATPLSGATCNATITNIADCPSGCTAAPIAGALAVATDSWSCMSEPAETSWTSVKATSTCKAGSAVTTYTLYGGQTEPGCKATAT